jgi:hypothetical protein
MYSATDPAAIGDLVRIATETGDNECLHRLWQAVMRLEQWHFMSTPVDEHAADMGNPQPVVGSVPELPDKPMLFAFTDDKRAWRAMVDNGAPTTSDAIPTVAMPLKRAAKYAYDLQQSGVWGILFNQNTGERGFYAPLANIAPMFEYHHGYVLPGIEADRPAPDFDSIAGAYKQTHAQHALHAYLRCLFHLKNWFFVSDQSSPNAPMLWTFSGELAIVGFTNPQRAAHAAEKMGILDEEGCANVLEMTPQETKGIFDAARQHGIHRIVFNGSSEPMPFETEALQSVIETM